MGVMVRGEGKGHCMSFVCMPCSACCQAILIVRWRACMHMCMCMHTLTGGPHCDRGVEWPAPATGRFQAGLARTAGRTTPCRSCICTCMCTCTCDHPPQVMHMHVYMCMHTCVYVYMCVCIHVATTCRSCTCTCTCTCICIHAYLCTCDHHLQVLYPGRVVGSCM